MRLIRSPLKEWLSSDYLETITCTADDTLASVIKRLLESGVHRVYVVDSKMRPVRVVSMRDILARFVKEPTADYVRKFFGSHSRGHYEGIRGLSS
jgi:CBS domain-containing protein